MGGWPTVSHRDASPSACLCHLLLVARTPDFPDFPATADLLQSGQNSEHFSTNPMGWNIHSPMGSRPSPGKGLLLSVTFLFSPRVPDMIFFYLQLLFYQSLIIQYIILNLFIPLCGFYFLTGPSLIQLCFKGIKT